MPVRILIPASEVKNRQKQPLILENDQLCSRCNQTPADHFELHRVQYRVALKHDRVYGKKYRTTRDYRVKLSVCETCYKSDFLTRPELLNFDKTPLARISRFHSTAWTIGALLAGFGFVLLTPVIPPNGILSTIKQMWQFPVIIGVIVLLLTWLSQKKYQAKVLHEIEIDHPNFKPLTRAEIRSIVMPDEEDLSATALEILLENESWAEACAQKNHWKYEQASKPEYDTLNKG